MLWRSRSALASLRDRGKDREREPAKHCEEEEDGREGGKAGAERERERESGKPPRSRSAYNGVGRSVGGRGVKTRAKSCFLTLLPSPLSPPSLSLRKETWVSSQIEDPTTERFYNCDTTSSQSHCACYYPTFGPRVSRATLRTIGLPSCGPRLPSLPHNITIL